METWQIILGVAVVLLPPILNWYSSRDYRISKDAEMEAKEAGYQAKESGYISQLASKDEIIRFLEMIADPKYVEKVEKIIGEQKSNIEKLQETNKQLARQLNSANSQNEALNKGIANISISEKERNNLVVLATGSSATLDQINKTAGDYEIVEGNLEKTFNEIYNIIKQE